MATVLLTGATGYIGSHTWLALAQAGFEVVGIDNFSNSSPEVLSRLQALMGAAPRFEQTDVCDAAAMNALFARQRIDATVHFAASKAVGESTQQPLAYYANNIGGLLTVCEAMRSHGCQRFVFSSSATVYGQPERLPITENAPLAATSPYGQTKLMAEQILRDHGVAEPTWQTACLRYFNPVGAHESGTIGEDPRGTPNNLMPYVAQVAVGRRPRLQVYGQDYPTPDGHLCHIGHQVVRHAARVLADAATLVCTDRIEVAQAGRLPAGLGSAKVAQDLLGHQLGLTVGAGGGERGIFVDG